ncbi:MAG: hypothetical protein ABWJ42_00300 [Sulfolobales archaeon]
MKRLYQWNPKWVRIKISMGDRVIETCKDITTNLIICPVCSDINRICPREREFSSIIPEKTVYFFSEEDLRSHLEAHVRSSEWGKIPSYEEEEREEEEEEEE